MFKGLAGRQRQNGGVGVVYCGQLEAEARNGERIGTCRNRRGLCRIEGVWWKVGYEVAGVKECGKDEEEMVDNVENEKNELTRI